MYQVEVINGGGSAFKIKSKDSEFIVDTKPGGITPPDMLLASLGSCIGVYIRKYAEGAKLAIGGFRVTVVGELSKETPHCFRAINVAIDIPDAGLDDRRKRAMLHFIKNCPVHNTLKSAPEVDIKIS